MVADLTFALPGGRLLRDCISLLSAAGVSIELDDDSRALVFEADGIRFILSRPGDVPIYVGYGAADIGVAGRDVLMEVGADVYEVLDLGFGLCRFVAAAPADRAQEVQDAISPSSRRHERLKVATKFPKVAEAFMKSRGLSAEIIPLKGATELAPRAGLAHIIVDLVSTGRTLAENDLVVVEEIGFTTARLIANRASFGLKAARLRCLVDSIRAVLKAGPKEGL